MILVKEVEVFWVFFIIIFFLWNNDYVEGEIEDIISKRMKILSWIVVEIYMCRDILEVVIIMGVCGYLIKLFFIEILYVLCFGGVGSCCI